MPCYHPLPGWISQTVNPSGKRSITFKRREGLPFRHAEVPVPCGQCIGCRLEKARQWAMRMVHERACWDTSLFVTLTYDQEHVPSNGSLRPADMTLFLKRLRFARKEPLRYFQCGEYGDVTNRPHHHMALFNCDFTDRVMLHRGAQANPLWNSAELDQLWGQGYCTFGDLTFESAAYVGGYVTKKVTGPRARAHYGERLPEYATMSRRPGLGEPWFRRFRADLQDDTIVLRGGRQMKPPKYYDRLLGKEEPAMLEAIKKARKLEAINDPDSTGPRLAVREHIANQKFSLKTRTL